MQPGLDNTPDATRSASTKVVLPPPDGPTSTTFRTAAGSSTAGAAPAPFELLDLSAMTSLPRGPRHRDARHFSPSVRAKQGGKGGESNQERRPAQACQLIQRWTATVITGPSSETDWY